MESFRHSKKTQTKRTSKRHKDNIPNLLCYYSKIIDGFKKLFAFQISIVVIYYFNVVYKYL